MSATAQPQERICFGEFELNLRTRELHTNGDRFDLPEQPFLVLTALLEQRGELVTRNELIKRLWPGDTFVDFEHSLNKAVKRLREALHDSAEKPRFIETLPRRGYRFIALITTDRSLEAATSAPTTSAPHHRMHNDGTPEAVVVAIPDMKVAPPRSEPILARWWSSRIMQVAIAVTVVALVATGFGIRKSLLPSRIVSLENVQIRKLTESGAAQLVAISPDARYVVYSERAGEKAGLWLRQVATRSDVQIVPPDTGYFVGLTFSPDGNYIYFVHSDKDAPTLLYLYAMPVLGGPARKILTNIDTAVSFSPDGHRFVFTRGISTRGVIEVWIANADGSGEQLLASLSDVDVAAQDGATWSPDGQTIAVSVTVPSKGSKRWVLDTVSVADSSVRELYSRPSGGLGRPVWWPGGRMLFVPITIPSERLTQLWAISYPRGEAQRVTNDLANYGSFIDITRDGNTVAAVESTSNANVWVVPSGNKSVARQLTFGGPPLVEVIQVGGHIVALSERGEAWKINPESGQRTLFVEASNVDALVPCGQHVVFLSAQPGGVQLMRADADGSNIITWMSIDSLSSVLPACSPDGKFLYYVTLGPPKTIWRIPTEGGATAKIASTLGDDMWNLSVSPDGKLLAYRYEVYSPEPATKLAIIPVKGGPPVKLLPVSGEIRFPKWSADGRGLEYRIVRSGVSNLWEQPLAGGEPTQITKFTSRGMIHSHWSWSADGKQLLLIRGEDRSDVVLISNFQ